MPNEKHAPLIALHSPAPGTERPLTSAEQGVAAALNRALTTDAAAKHDVAATALLQFEELAKIERQRQAFEAMLLPNWLGAAAEVQRALEMRAAHTQAMGLVPSVSVALTALERSALAHEAVLSPLWLKGLSAAALGSVGPQVPTHLLDGLLRERLAEQFGRLTGPALDVARIFEQEELRHPKLAAVLGPPHAAQQAWEDLSRLNAAAIRTWDFLGARPDLLGRMSPRLAGTPVIEVYAAAHATTLVRAPEKENQIETVSSLEEALEDIGGAFEARLSDLDPALVMMYRGGVERVERGGTDWPRQALTSFRELANHTLHLLAPDAAVKPWARPDHFEDGNLTRKARLEYVVREVASGDLADFLATDLKSTLALFNFLHTVHKKDPALNQRQLRLVYNRVRGAISALLEAAGR